MNDQYKYHINIQQSLSPSDHKFTATAIIDSHLYRSGQRVTQQHTLPPVTASTKQEAESKMKAAIETWIKVQRDTNPSSATNAPD